MFNTQSLDEIATRIARAIEASPAKDIEKNVKAMLQGGLSRLDMVTRAEFDAQVETLARTRALVETLGVRVEALEAGRAAANGNPPAADQASPAS